LIDLAYRVGEQHGVPVWCQDEAGPYQAVPHPGVRWQPLGQPARQPHEYQRGGTAKLLTLFHPATGAVRAQGVTSGANTVLHPWLQRHLQEILATLPAAVPLPATHPLQAHWATLARSWLPDVPLPPLRLILVWDNLAGHKSHDLVRWLCAQGILPLYTPLSGSWLTMAASVQRILVPRALDGQHPTTPQEVIAALEETVAGWNTAPTPFVWAGKRRARRARARQRRLGGSGAVFDKGYSIAA
jgi:hypothetical protein